MRHWKFFTIFLLAAAASSQAQDYPTRLLRLVTGFLPGGVSDTITRVTGFDPLKAFAPVSLIATGPTLLAVHPSLPVSSVKELIAYAKTQAGGLRFGSSGAGTTNHLSGELLRVMANMPLTHVPYRGAAVNVVAAIQGEIHISFLPLLAAIPHVKSGRLKALGVTGAKRSLSMPDVPTVGEVLPGYEVSAWYGIVVPAATPQPIVKRLNAELVKLLAEHDVRERLTAQGVDVQSSTIEELAELIRVDAIRWAKLVKVAGLVLE